LLFSVDLLSELTLLMYSSRFEDKFVVPVRATIASLIDSGSSDENPASVKLCFSTSFSMWEARAKTGTDPVTPAELDENVLVARAMTENFSKLSFPSLVIDKSPP
jgi:hypothetical protein